jgi:transketolase
MRFIGTQDTFGESGKPTELLEKYGLSPKHIEKAVVDLLDNK